jgi:hypothetical protein
MINVHGHETYLVLQLFYTLLQLAPRLSSIREVEVRVADLRAEKRVLLPQAGLDMFAIDEEVLGDGPQSAERETGARLEAEGGQEASTQHCPGTAQGDLSLGLWEWREGTRHPSTTGAAGIQLTLISSSFVSRWT